ncbi:hypothetical protein C6P42_003041 [Pichia californica]|nr:hypothetical protein C6P42_003041 [[Candida] californica]
MPSVKTQEHAAVEKPPKAGRKPLLSEPKNKRTAQNRAAQRAFRERKEKRMLELEDKVKLLEQEKTQIANESELLRIQVKSLMKQLGKSINNDLDEIKYSSSNRIINYDNDIHNYNEGDDLSSIRRNSLLDDRNTSSNSSISSITPGSSTSDDIFHFPKSNSKLVNINSISNANTQSLELSDKLNNKSFKDNYDEHIFCKELSQVCGSSSCPIPKRNTPKPTSNSPSTVASNNTNNTSNTNNTNNTNNNKTNNNLFTSTSSMTSPSIISSEISNNFNNSPFDKSLFDDSPNIGSDFNTNINFNLDIHNDRTNDGSSTNDMLRESIGNGLDSYAFLDNNNNGNKNGNNNSNNNNNNNNINKNDEMNFLFDDDNKIQNNTNDLIQKKPEAFQFDSDLLNNNFETNLDLDFDTDDVFDTLLKIPFEDSDKLSPSNKSNEIIVEIDGNDKVADKNEDKIGNDDETVPDNTQNLMKCSQIWERITTHPRFTDLDIDNLCDELKQKAKCSESGVVVDGTDVGKLLHKATCDKQKQLDKSREIDIKRSAMSHDTNGFLNGFW